MDRISHDISIPRKNPIPWISHYSEFVIAIKLFWRNKFEVTSSTLDPLIYKASEISWVVPSSTGWPDRFLYILKTPVILPPALEVSANMTENPLNTSASCFRNVYKDALVLMGYQFCTFLSQTTLLLSTFYYNSYKSAGLLTTIVVAKLVSRNKWVTKCNMFRSYPQLFRVPHYWVWFCVGNPEQ